MRPGLPRTSSINFQRSAAPPDFDRSQTGLLRLRCLCCLSIQGCSPPSQALQKFCEPGTAGRGDSPAFQIALEVKERISYFHRRRGRNARVCVRNMPGLKFMPCTKNKTGLFQSRRKLNQPAAIRLPISFCTLQKKSAGQSHQMRIKAGAAQDCGYRRWRGLPGKKAELRQRCVSCPLTVAELQGASNRGVRMESHKMEDRSLF